MLKTWFDSEVARFKKHPVFWTVVTVLNVGMIVKMHRENSDLKRLAA